MEPFEISLNQVNFDEEAFGDSDELHSFSNLVSYDSDFKEDRSEGFPVRSRRIKQYEVADSFHCSQVNHMARVMNESKIDVGGSVPIIPVNKDAGTEETNAECNREINDLAQPKSDVMKISDSFKAFTETVEALALQKSVIGKKNIVPASAAEVARVVAATRARLSNEHRQKSSDSLAEAATLALKGSDVESVTSAEDSYPLSNNSAIDAVERATSVLPKRSWSGPVGKISDDHSSAKETLSEPHLLVEVNSQDVLDSSFVQSAEVIDSPSSMQHEPDNLPLRRVVEAKKTLTESNTDSGSRQSLEGFGISSSAVSVQGTSAAAGSSPRIPEGKELIRISPKDISTASKKSQSSWFWSKPSSEVTSSKQDSVRRTQTIKNSDHDDAAVAKKQPKRATTKHEALVSAEAKANTSTASNQTQQQKPEIYVDVRSSAKSEVNPAEMNSVKGSKTSPVDSLTQLATVSSETQNPEFKASSRSLSSQIETPAPVDASMQHLSSNQIKSDPYKTDNVSVPPTNSASQHRSTVSGKSEEFQQTVLSSSRTSSALVANEIYRQQPIHKTMSLNSDINGRPVSRQDSLDSAFSGSKDDLQLRLEQILKEKVKLEGQVEVLESESSVLLRERAELQTKVAALMQELQSREKTRVGLAGDRDALSADLETLRQNRARLEAVIMDAHKLLEDKDQDLKTLENDLELARDASEKQLDQLKNFRMEVKSRDATITDLKTKITELYVEFQTTNQNRILAENEVGSLQGELKSMGAAKEWYKDQLQFSQREKAELQAEVTRVKTEMISQGTAIERLKAENQRTKRQLAESEQRSLNEKQTLARHLESIEADMMEREAAFAQLQKDRENVISSVQDEISEGEVVGILREDLSKATSELKRSQGQVTILQHEQKELLKRLALSQESILERDKAVESLEKSVVELESQLKQTQLEFTTCKEEIERLEHDRTVLQMELKSAKEEKEVFDSSLRSLKDDMGVVEKSFRLMKQELLTKQSELDRLKAETGNAGTKLESVPEQTAKLLHEIPQGFEFSPVHNIVRSLTKYQSSETQTNREPDEEIGGGCEAADNKVDSEVLKRLENEKDLVEKQLFAVQQLLETADTEKQQLSKNLLSVEQELVILRERSLDLELKLQQSYDEKEVIECSLEEERNRVDEKRQTSEDGSKDMVQLQMENNALKSQLGDLQRESHKEIAKHKTKMLKLGKELEMALKDHRNTCRMHDQQVEELRQRLAALEETNTRLEGELVNAQQRAALDQDDRMSQMHLEFQRLTEELESVRNAKHSTETELNQVILCHQSELDDYKARSAELETELQSAKIYIEERKAADTETANLALELEREKGRLAGFIRSHSTLKEHASLLEASLANKESSVVQMSSEVEELLQTKDRQIQDLTEQVHLLEECLAKEQQNTKDARTKLMTEKGNHIKVRRELEQLTSKHSQIVAEVELLRKELSKMSEDAEATKNDQAALKLKMEQMLAEMKTVRLDRDRMSRELEDREARDSTLHEQVQSLEWKLSQKVAEMTAAEEKAHLVDERRQAEANGLNQSLQITSSELYSVRDELATVKHERAELKARTTQLRQVLMSIVEQCTKATEAGKAITIQMIMNKEELEKLLEESSAPSIQSKPLSFLQATLSGLRGEISSLQKQVNEHTSDVQNSSQSWRQLEAQVEDLRQVCKSSAAQRAASDKLLKTTEALSQLPPLTDIQMALQLPSTGPLILPGNKVSIIKTTSSSSSTKLLRTETGENERT